MIFLYFVALVVAFVLIALLKQRTAALEETVANLRQRIGVLEGARFATAPRKIEHPPVVDRPRPASAPPIQPTILVRESPVSPRRNETAPVPTRPDPSVARVNAPSAVTASSSESIEAVIGSRWLLYVGVAAIVIGAAYFQKLAMDNHWIDETARVIEGGIVGLVLVGGGLRMVRRGYSLYGQMLSGCGVAVMYVSTYAAFNFYHLISRPSALIVMCGITALAAWLADRQRSQGLAILAVGGGFATPFLLPSGADAQIALFSYEAVLIAGTMFLAHRRTWPTLNLVSYLFTVLTVAAWMAAFYAPSKYIATEFFLTLFCGMFLYVLQVSPPAARATSTLSRGVLWTGPFLYYFASLFVLGSHPLVELVFLILISLVGAAIGVWAREDGQWSGYVRLIFWVAVAIPFAGWIATHQAAAWLTAGLVATAAFYAIHLIAHLESTAGENGEPTLPDLVLLHFNGLFVFGAAYWLLNGHTDTWTAPLALLLALWHGGIARSIWMSRREQALHFAAVASTLLVFAIGLQFEGAWETMGWAAEGAVIAALGLTSRRDWVRMGGLVLFAISLMRLLTLQLLPPPLDQLVILNERAACGLLVTGLTYWLASMHRRHQQPERRDGEVAMFVVLAKLLVLSFLTSEINAYWYEPAVPLHYVVVREALLSIAWAALGAVIVALGLTRARGWIRGIGAAVLAIAVLRLIILELQAPGPAYVVLANARMLASAAVVAILYFVAVRYREWPALDAELHPRALLLLGANALTLTFLTSEIFAFWSLRDGLVASRYGSDGHFAREMMLSITWAAYAAGLVVTGMRKHYAPIRYLAFVIFGVTILKVFAVDLSELDRIYRVASIIALGVTLLITSYFYHRFKESLAT